LFPLLFAVGAGVLGRAVILIVALLAMNDCSLTLTILADEILNIISFNLRDYYWFKSNGGVVL
jgi:hypothetical protein